MRNFVLFCFFIFSFHAVAQSKKTGGLNLKNSSKDNKSISKVSSKDTLPTIDWYKIIKPNNLVTHVDTALTIGTYQKFNFLAKDMFGIQNLTNDGQSFALLDFGLNNYQLNPSFGFKAKEFNYLQINSIDYYNVPTPFTELSYRSVTKQGQNLNSLFTTNINQRLNLFIGYRALRSLGAYLNELNSIGNFRLGGSYNTKNENYFIKANITVQDIMNQENGGITDIDLFQSSEPPFNNRERLNVYFRDAKTLFKGIRTFLDHQYKFNNSNENEFLLKHRFFYEYKSNRYQQDNLATVDSNIKYFGNSFSNSINDQVRYKNFYNKLALAYRSKTLGELAFNVDFSNIDYYYNSMVVKNNTEVIPPSLKFDLITLGGAYNYSDEKFNFNTELRQSISNVPTTEFKAAINYKFNDIYQLKANYQFLSKIPELTSQLFQSSYVQYNWVNNFSNEKIQVIDANLQNPFVNLSGNFQLISDRIYFKNTNNKFDGFGIAEQQLIAPEQYSKTIGYFSIKAQKEFKYQKFALDNTILFQQVSQDDNIINVPSFITRNTLYYTDKLFKNALFLQTGIVFNYHTKYYANEYNPVIGDFFVQNSRKVGGYPTFDLFVNAKIKTARIFLSLEHFNSKFTGYNYFVTPTRPMSDMRLRFGIVWDFFN